MIEKLKRITSLGSATKYSELARDIIKKYENLNLHLNDLRLLENYYNNREKQVINKNGTQNMIIYDKIPEIRFISACESTVNNLYALSALIEILAHFINPNKYPSKFHQLLDNFENEVYGKEAKNKIGNFDEFKEIKKIRTEVVHYSSLHIFEDKNEINLWIDKIRYSESGVRTQERIITTFNDFISNLKKSLESINNLILYLIENEIIQEFEGKLDIKQKFAVSVNTNPNENILNTEEMTLREFITRIGIDLTMIDN